ncbi:MAG: AtpZ/AtpI family protein [Spirochaetia bacterium]
MNKKNEGSKKDFLSKIEKMEKRKIRARNRKESSVWFGLGMFGLVGWSVAIPSLIGLGLGIWLDTRVGSDFSWTLMLLTLGVIAGALNAWLWVKREQEKIRQEFEDTEEEDNA